MTQPFIIAIDGPAASGKGTLARKPAAGHDSPLADSTMIATSFPQFTELMTEPGADLA